MNNEISKYTSEMFRDAIEFNSQTAKRLNEKEVFYSEDLQRKGFEVRFNETHIMHRMAGDGSIFSFLRSNLKMN